METIGTAVIEDYTFSDSTAWRGKPLLGSLGCYRYTLKEPLEFKMEVTEHGVVAFIEEPISEWGEGKTESEAIDDLKTSIIDYFYSLQHNKRHFAKGLKSELRWLEKHLDIQWFDY